MSASVSVSPFEFVMPDVELRVDAPERLDARTALAALRLRGAPGAVSLSRTGRRAVVRTDAPLPPGRHVLEVDGLVTVGGRPLPAPREIPFFVLETRARVPSTLRIGNYTRLTVRGDTIARTSPFERTRGAYLDLAKTTHRTTGQLQLLAFDRQGRRVDADAVFRSVAEARARRYGKLHPSLYRRMQGERDPIPVAVWLVHDDPPRPRERSLSPDPAAWEAIERPRRERLAYTRRSFLARPALARSAVAPRADAHAPVVYAALTPREIREAAADPAVAAIFFDDRSVALDLSDAMADARAADAHALDAQGEGVRVGVFEDGPDTLDQLTLAASYAPGGETSAHARLVHGIIKNSSDERRGFAPRCELYSVNSTKLEALVWAMEQRCTVINQSFHRTEEESSGELSYDDVYKDWLAINAPYPTIVQAAGNAEEFNLPKEYVNHKGYNTLSVGSHADAASKMSPFSVYRNPASPRGDRELPELCANGDGVSAVGLSMSGTSFAAPAVAGCVALIQGVDGNLKSSPEGCRAVLLAGARINVRDATWWANVASPVDARDGVGAVDAAESVRIARQRVTPNSDAAQRGWDMNLLSNTAFDASTQLSAAAYRVSAPEGFDGAPYVKAALAWNSTIKGVTPEGVSVQATSMLTVDLDLMVYDEADKLVASSQSWDNSYEVAEFVGEVGKVYTIKVRRTRADDDTWYALAWTVTAQA